MGTYKYTRKLWTKPKAQLGDLWKQRLIEWRAQTAQVKLDHPTRPDRARALGYRAKQGVVTVRVRVNRGGFMRPKAIMGGRRTAHAGRIKSLRKNYQTIAEERVADKHPNCEVLNSYYVAHDGKHQWFEVILADRSHPAVLASKQLSWVGEKQHRGRVYRGLTAAAKRYRIR